MAHRLGILGLGVVGCLVAAFSAVPPGVPPSQPLHLAAPLSVERSSPDRASRSRVERLESTPAVSAPVRSEAVRAPVVPPRRLQRPTTQHRASQGTPVRARVTIRDPGTLNWAALRQCEAGGNYANKSNPSFRGAYQASWSTWSGYWKRHGRPDLVGKDPANASAADQDAFAFGLYAERGRQPWPVCGRRL